MTDQRQPPLPHSRSALTFDNGPEPDVTPSVLDILARRGIITTFFTIGEKLPIRHVAPSRPAPGRKTIRSVTHADPRRPTRPPRRSRRSPRNRRNRSTPRPAGGTRKTFRPNGGGGLLGSHLLNASAEGSSRTADTPSSCGALSPRLRGPRRLARPRLRDARDGHRASDHGPARPAQRRHPSPRPGPGHLAGPGHHLLPTAPDACVPMRAGRPGPKFNDFVSPDSLP